MFIVSKLIGYVLGILTIATIFLAGWLLQLMGKDHGRWQSFTMFLPAILWLLGAVLLKRNGRKAVGAYITSGLFFAFGICVLFVG